MEDERLQLLKRKYFWEQKRKEIAKFIFIIFLIAFIPLATGFIDLKLFGCSETIKVIFESEACSTSPISSTSCSISSTFELWVYGFSIDLILIPIGFFGYISYIIFNLWVKNNWEKAEKRARETLGVRERR